MKRIPENSPPFYSASDRNKHPILEQLLDLLPQRSSVLEIGSGWGQHAVFFCKAMPGLRWQPTDRGESLTVLKEQLEAEGIPGILSPLALEVIKDNWPSGKFQVVYSANTAHIMSRTAVSAMFAGAGKCLVSGGLFCLYGPFNINGCFVSAGNETFDSNLRAQDPEKGIRDVGALESLAFKHQMILRQRISMPANNFLLVFEKAA